MIPFGSSCVAALDANVLFGYPLRDTLLYAVEAGLYRPIWSEEIWAEVARNLQDPRRKRPHAPSATERLLAAIRRSFPEAFISGYEPLIPAMPVDPKDRHVAALAVHGGAQFLITYNRRHFPASALASYGIDVQHPDEFLYSLYERAPFAMAQVVRDQAAPLTNPPITPREILDDLERAYITRFARAIRADL